MRFPLFCLAAVGAAAMFLGGCSTAPETNTDRTELNNDTQAAMNDFKAQDPSLDNLLGNSYGYAIFPSVGKGAVGVGGAYGQGEVYQGSKLVGYADMTQASVGAVDRRANVRRTDCFPNTTGAPEFPIWPGHLYC